MQGFVVNGFFFERQVGEGGFANTYTAIHQKTGSRVCIKVLSKLETTEEDFLNEVEILKKIVHPCIVLLNTYFQDFENYYIVMEFAKGMTLLDFVNNAQGEISLNTIKHITVQLVSIVNYLHNVAKVAHRDIKLENIIIDSSCNIKLIDFGLSKMLKSDKSYMKTFCGSEAYVAPEIVERKQYTSSSDIWSVGVVLYALAVGTLPFYDSNIERMNRMIRFQEPVFPSEIDNDLYDLISSLLTKDHKSRPTASDLLNSKFLSNSIDQNMLDKDYYIKYAWDNRFNESINSPYAMKLEKLGFSFKNTCEKVIKGINDESTAALKIIFTTNDVIVSKQEESSLPSLKKSNRTQCANLPERFKQQCIFTPHRKTVFVNKKARIFIHV